MDAGAAEAATVRQQAMAAIRGRAQQYVGSWVKDSECVQIALASATREPGEMLEFLFSKATARLAAAHTKHLAITAGEWGALFGAHARPTRTGTMDALITDVDFQSSVTQMQNALRCTVGERSIGESWGRNWTRAACIFAMHTEGHEDLLASSLGSVVKADSRRLDDYRSELEEEGMDTMFVGQVLVALADTVT